MGRGVYRTITAQVWQWKKTQDPIRKITEAKKSWRCGSSGIMPA
jgi:hypothetical protein